MKRLITPFFPALCALLLSGCWNGRVLFSFEQPFWASLGDDARTRIALAQASMPLGFLPRFVVTGSQEGPSGRLARDVSTGRYRTVVVGPLLSLEWRSFAPRFPETKFILVGGARAQDLPSNAVLLLYDRASAFRDAGFAAGVSVRDEAPGAAPSSLVPRIALLLSSAPDLTGEESDAFMAGVAEALDGARPAVSLVQAPAEPSAVKVTLARMRQEGVEIFLLAMGSLDPWCLEVMRDVGGCAVVADWQASGAFPGQVFLSVEEDISGGIARALAVAGQGIREVSGPVRLAIGKARLVPEKAKGRVEGK